MAQPQNVRVVLWALMVLLMCQAVASDPDTAITAPAKLHARDFGEPLLFSRQVDLNVYSYLIEAKSPQYQTAVSQKNAQGYAIISLSIYGPPADPFYTAVWSKRPGTVRPQLPANDLTGEGLDSIIEFGESQGYIPALLTATGSAANPVFACVMEIFPENIEYMWRYGMTIGTETTEGSWRYWNRRAADNGMILKSFSIYGTTLQRRWAAVWHANPKLVRWHQIPESAQVIGQYDRDHKAETADTLLRPAYVAIDSAQVYTSLFTDERLGPGTSFAHRWGMTRAELQTAINQYSSQSMYPVKIQAGGNGSDIRYVAIFSPTEVPSSRVWSQPSGQVSTTGINNPSQAVSIIDNLVKGYMQQYAVRHAQISIKKNGAKRIDRAYTWSEQGRCGAAGCEITPAHKFLLASNSKLFVTAAMTKLLRISSAKINNATRVYQYLGYTAADAVDPRSMQITIKQLIEHTGGWDKETTGFDPTYLMRDVARVQHNDGRPATKKDVVDYMLKRPLDFTPGSRVAYSNYGYLLLSVVVEKVTSLDYYTWLSTNVLRYSGIDMAQIGIYPTAQTPRPSGEILQEEYFTGLSAVEPASTLFVPAIYGGDGMIKEVDAGGAGVTCSMDALTKFISANAVYGMGPRYPVFRDRIGSTPGAWTYAASRADGIDWAIAFNTRNWPNQEVTPVQFMGRINVALDMLGIF